MAAKWNRNRRIARLVRSILAEASAGGAGKDPSREEEHEIRQLLVRDYESNLRNIFEHSEISDLVAAASAIWPNFNRSLMGPPSMRHFAEVSEHLSLHFSSAPYRGSGGFAVRGFYLHQTPPAIGKPLIYVNSAHHPLAVGTAFCHEVGHHLSSGMFPRQQPRQARLYFGAECSERLDDQVELAADILVSLAGYPQPMARQIFSKSPARDTPLPAGAPGGDVFDAVREHLRKRYGFDLTAILGPTRKLNYLAGMIHYARLREALLAEYGV